MAGEIVTTTSTLDDLFNVMKAQAIIVATNKPGLKNYCRRVRLTPPALSVDFPIYGNVAAASLTEADDMSFTAVSTSKASITVGEYGIATKWSDLSKQLADPGEQVRIGTVLGNAIADAQDQAIWALFDGFSQSVGATNTNITEANLTSALQYLDNAGAPMERALFLTPYQMADLKNLFVTSTSITSNAIRDELYRTGTLSSIFGVPIVVVGNLAAGSSAGQKDAADAKGGMMVVSTPGNPTQGAIGFCDVWDVKIELQRDASARATELVCTAAFGVGEIVDTYGVEVFTDNKD